MGIGSNKHNLVGVALLILQTSSSPTGSKALKAGGDGVGASVAEPEVGNASRILLILSQKSKANLSARLLSEL